MQLDVDVSPSVNIITFRLGLTHKTMDLDPCDFWPDQLEFFLVDFFPVTFFGTSVLTKPFWFLRVLRIFKDRIREMEERC